MGTPEKAWKHIQRRLRDIPVEDIAPRIAAWEREGFWCLVANELQFISSDGGVRETCWDDPLEYAQFARWVRGHPERKHQNKETALEFVRSHFGR